MWLAGGGVKPGICFGETDQWCFNIADKPVSVHDLYATMLKLMGVDHERLTYRFQGRDYRLTDLYGKAVSDIMA